MALRFSGRCSPRRALTSSVTGGLGGQSVLLHLFDDGAFPRLSGTYGEYSTGHT